MAINRGARELQPEPGQLACFSNNLATSLDNSRFSAHHLRIDPGGKFLEHQHEREMEMHYVISGQCEALDRGEWKAIAAGDVVLCEPGSLHALRNEGAEPVHILCVFTPPLV